MAPENGGSGDVGDFPFEEIWQYGSDLNQPGADDMWLQDGVAPQVAIKNIFKLAPSNKSGRAFIPKNQNIPKGFVESHSIVNYGWIFNIQPNQGAASNGYIMPR